MTVRKIASPCRLVVRMRVSKMMTVARMGDPDFFAHK